jgi:outer membrane protein OmpA-like peptidoglycan-associated protein
MKKAILMTAIISLTSTAAMADFNKPTGEDKKGGVIVGSFITGAAAGGPLGALAGALVGAWLGEQVKEADRVEIIEGELISANDQLNQLTHRLAQTEKESQKLAQIALDQLQLELLFKTGNSDLTNAGTQRMTFLADFMVNNPELNIQLDGYADPRGSADYNLTLSDQRVQSVAQLLTANGVDEDRIVTQSHGASQSLSAVGDYDSYAMERVVKIKLTKNNDRNSYAQVTINH